MLISFSLVRVPLPHFPARIMVSVTWNTKLMSKLHVSFIVIWGYMMISKPHVLDSAWACMYMCTEQSSTPVKPVRSLPTPDSSGRSALPLDTGLVFVRVVPEQYPGPDYFSPAHVGGADGFMTCAPIRWSRALSVSLCSLRRLPVLRRLPSEGLNASSQIASLSVRGGGVSCRNRFHRNHKPDGLPRRAT